MNRLTLQEMLSRLISAASVSSVNPTWDMSNREVIQHLHDWFSSLGFSTEVLPIPGHSGKFNLIASAGQGDEGLVLSGHSDTVPFDE
ncbi:MAG: acetylornithine deacetylase, partial [Candidatus Thiodiazotropha sp.]